MATALINTAMLTWARERAGFAVSDFSHKCGVTEERLLEWETGQREITFNQAMTYAEKAYVPFGYLFLQAPPVEELPIPDLRTIDGHGVQKPSAELVDLIKQMLERQEWYKDYLKQNFADVNSIVGRFSVNDSVDAIVSDIRQQLGVGLHPQRGKWDEYYRDLVKRIEAAGILVMRQSNMGHHSRPLQVDEFRGFAMADEYAPMIFINHADAPGPRLFTLIHELCHIWIGQSGVSDGSSQSHRREEVLCNAVAAEFLVPEDEFVALWREDLDDWHDNLAPLEAHFHVSKWVLTRRALTLNFIDQAAYVAFVNAERAAFRNRTKSGKGPTYYQTKKAQLSQPFSQAVVSNALSGQLLLREAGQLLGGIKPGKIAQFAKELGV